MIAGSKVLSLALGLVNKLSSEERRELIRLIDEAENDWDFTLTIAVDFDKRRREYDKLVETEQNQIALKK